ncbi:UDP-glycosyltransferase family, conserved site [Sesbania bispinosa]|nr:UDP-glycosyltransferase family, conserved site [Sesbania bispinosa]
MLTPKPHAALLASPGIGHLIPTLELGKRLLTHHGFDVTIFVIAIDSSTTTSQILQQTSNVSSLNTVIAPPIDVSTKLGPHPSIPAQIGLIIHESLPFLRSSILSMKHPPSALIVDLFGTVAFPLAREFGMSTYVFFATNAWFSALTIYLPFLDKQMAERHTHNHEPLLIPVAIRFGSRTHSYRWRHRTGLYLEPEATKALIEPGILGRFTKGPVYAVGPLVRTVEVKSYHGEDEAVLRWLDRQVAESVMYVSFGSGGTMSESQMRELALGLELSQQRQNDVGLLAGGFLRRTQGIGLVVPMWAPQSEILRHPATAGFMTHCGWNSVLESMVNGIPMIAWPLYAEQKMNAFILSEKIGVAVRVKEEEEGIVCREHIAELVRRVIVDEEGVAMRTKVKEVKLSGEKASSKFGTSYKSLYQMAKDCEFHRQGSEPKARGALLR